MAKKEEAKKLCFVVGPIGDADSDIRIHADWLLEEIIEPTFKDFPDFKVVRADKISQPGMIDAQVIEHLLDADLVIADLSMLNPNAFYEIGIRHMAQKSIIHMQLNDDKIPFDVSLYRAIKFSRIRPAEIRDARKQLKSALDSVLAEGYEVDNPVTRVRGRIELEESATPEQKVFLSQLRSLENRIENMESRPQIGSEWELKKSSFFDPDAPNSEVVYVHFNQNSSKIHTSMKTVTLFLNEAVDEVKTKERDSVIEVVVPKNYVGTTRWENILRNILSFRDVTEVSEIPF